MSNELSRRGFVGTASAAGLGLTLLGVAMAAEKKAKRGAARAASAPRWPSYMEPRHLLAKTYNSGFKLAHDTYNGMGTGSDGKIYYVLSSEKFDSGAQVYSFDPAAQKIQHLGDLTEACGEKDE